MRTPCWGIGEVPWRGSDGGVIMQEKGLLTVLEERLNIAGTDRSKKHRQPRSLGISFSQISVLFLCTMLSMTIVNQNAFAATWDPEEEISSDVGTE
ncbi:MAG: hypothetical protein E3J35_11600, partial [Methanomassiliicoccales archaeon]